MLCAASTCFLPSFSTSTEPSPRSRPYPSTWVTLLLRRRKLTPLESRSATVRLRSCAGAQVRREIGERDAVAPRALQLVDQKRAAQERLGRDATDVQAHAAQFVRFDARGLQAELARADRRDVTARSSANDDNVEVCSNCVLVRQEIASGEGSMDRSAAGSHPRAEAGLLRPNDSEGRDEPAQVKVEAGESGVKAKPRPGGGGYLSPAQSSW